MLDVTGLLGVGALAALGVGVLPYKRHQMKVWFCHNQAFTRFMGVP
jgi:hypothetical protein